MSIRNKKGDKHVSKFELGALLRDRISGFEGVAISHTRYLSNCDRYGLQPKVGTDGKLPESQWFDETTLEQVGLGILAPEPTRSGKTGADGRDTPNRARPA